MVLRLKRWRLVKATIFCKRSNSFSRFESWHFCSGFTTYQPLLIFIPTHECGEIDRRTVVFRHRLFLNGWRCCSLSRRVLYHDLPPWIVNIWVSGWDETHKHPSRKRRVKSVVTVSLWFLDQGTEVMGYRERDKNCLMVDETVSKVS